MSKQHQYFASSKLLFSVSLGTQPFACAKQCGMKFSGLACVCCSRCCCLVWYADGESPTHRLNNPVKDVTLSNPTAKQASVTEAGVFRRCLAFSMRTEVRY